MAGIPKRLSAALATGVVFACAEASRAIPRVPAPWEGDWVAVSPQDVVGERVRIDSGGGVMAAARVFGILDYETQRWRLEPSLMPTGFCVGEARNATSPGREPRASCFGFLRVGDTLLLANSVSTVLVVESSWNPDEPFGRSQEGLRRALSPAPPRSGR
jgi:hypothetical protein